MARPGEDFEVRAHVYRINRWEFTLFRKFCTLSAMKVPVLSILTVNFGSSAKVKKLWKSLQENLPGVSWEWIIVDNPTKKGGDGAKLEKMFANEKQVHVIQMAKNLGYGGGNEAGFRFCHGEFLAILNPDTLVTEGVFDKLLGALKSKNNVALVVPVLKTETGMLLENCRTFPTFTDLIKRRLFGAELLPGLPKDGVREIDWAQGSFWVLRSQLFETLKGFDPRFFLFLEDTDFCRRVWDKGLRVLQVADALAIHSPNRLSGGNVLKALARKTFWIHLSSAIKYFRKWAGKKLPR